ncbi:alanine--tRNA ligase [Candidatus Pacearchaeota archaeon]|jgi:alanyl-tRNA synthetase|nr:alanine--tRNA ligase [Candidatus Pacearchaeota archaeon]|tara:strand:- start:4329 stop:6077 length:1749 start_codon:yes stop_codon:yes gene_type:complete
MINRKELIKKYIDFFKLHNHKEIPNVSLIPENDPTVLFTTAGMHPLVPYLLGQKHPQGKRLVNVQRCIRTQDIEEVGDTSHHTFFEMLGNWSLGDYFKKEAIEYSFEFLTKVLKIPIERLAVSIFKGDKDAPKDKESAKTWESLGMKKERIVFLPKKDNWWGPAGQTGPCGPSTEMFYWKSNKIPVPKKFNPNDERWVEIWNDVLMEYNKDKNGKYNLAKQKNIDTGMGVERTISILNGLEDDYLTDSFKPIIERIENLSNRNYNKHKERMRIIADHIKAAVFIISDGVLPSNTEQGYVLRRLIRRSVRYGKEIGIKNFAKKVAEPVFDIYNDYSRLKNNKKKILQELEKEESRFLEKIEQGTKIFEKITINRKKISGKDAFLLYQSYGFPFEMTKELAKEKNIKIDEKSFDQEQKKHQELSRTSTEGKFKSGLADHSEATTKLHTATHLLLAALRKVLKDEEIIQKGSNINPERLRLDFNYPKKLTKEELKKIEGLVNSQIQKSYEVIMEEMSPSEAKKKGALGVFDAKYGEVVSVYTIKNCSKEICAGPHVENISELGHFKIKKEESSSEGVRRIKAILE